MRFILVNRTKLVSDDDAAIMAGAVDLQLARDIGPSWGRNAPTMTFFRDPKNVPTGPGVAIFDLQDEDPEVPDALGFHDESKGHVYAPILCKPILDAGGTALSTVTCVASVLSHEAAETFGDATVNLWADMSASRATAYELCDPVQDVSYPITVGKSVVMVSDFVLPAWFDRQATVGPFDFLKRLHKPFTMTHGGYQIVRTNGKETQIFGEVPPHKRGRYTHRQRRRGLVHVIH